MLNARGARLQTVLHLASAMAFILYGWDAGVIGGILPTPQFQSQIGHFNTNLLTFMAAAILLGDVVGCIIVTPLVWQAGRRKCIVVACVIGILGIILQAATYSAAQMIVGRFVLGLGNGVISAVVPIYVQETSVGTDKDRTYGVLVTVGYGVAGIAVANWMDYGMYKSSSINAWRAPLAMQALFLIVAIVLLFDCPETPRWLYGHNRIAEADSVLSRLLDKDTGETSFQALRNEILASVKLETEDGKDKLTLSGLLMDKSETKIARRIWLSWMVAFGAPLFGGNLIIFYSSSIFEHLGLSIDLTTILTASLNTATPFGMIFSFWLLPRFGRRPLLIWGGVGQLLCMVIFTILSNLGSKTTSAANWGAVATLFVYQTINGATWIWLPYLYAVEIVPLKYRGQVNSIGTAAFWMLAFVEVYAGPIALDDPRVGSKIFIWFCLGGALVLGWVIADAKETKGLSLEGIDLLWASEDYVVHNAEARIIEGLQVDQKNGSLATTSSLPEKV